VQAKADMQAPHTAHVIINSLLFIFPFFYSVLKFIDLQMYEVITEVANKADKLF
jgi:hypothetical protein